MLAFGGGAGGAPLPLGLGDERVQLVVAGDVLVYFGELYALLRALGALLEPVGGRLVFTVEALEHAPLDDGAERAARAAGWALTPSGRYAHSAEHVADAARAARLEVLAAAEIVPRVDKGRDVRGHLFVLGRGGTAGGQRSTPES